jgi:HAE1 family hydrophobic/amphiphilic exporter-1
MRRPDLRFDCRRLVIGVVIAAVGFFLLRAYWVIPEDVVVFRYSVVGWPLNRSDAVRVRLDFDRMRARGISRDDVMKALTPSGLIGPVEPPPRHGVVIVTHIPRPDWCENIVLKANSEGEVVRLKDVAKVESSW